MTARARLAGLLLGERALHLRRGLAELGRRARGRPHRVEAFLELDDPNSYLLANYLDELAGHYAIELRCHLVEACGGDFRPRPALYQDYAISDCARFAAELGLPFLDRGASPPVEHRRALLDTLAVAADVPDFPARLQAAITAYWRGDAEAVGRRCDTAVPPGQGNALLDRNRTRLRRLGHYDAATLYYGGEWYRGIDRLQYLVDRLDGLGLAREAGLAPRIATVRQTMRTLLPAQPPAAARQLPPVEVFYSLRSPYCWLALERLIRIADAFGTALVFRPVLPMVLRGVPLPRDKRRYLLLDAAREARRHGVAFGRIADPLGIGVERLMAVWQTAVAAGRERAFLKSAGEAVWSRGIDVRRAAGLRRVTAAAGLAWDAVEAGLGDERWRDVAAGNAAALDEAGAWGVPAIRIGDWLTWGQDRDWLVARQLEELCDNGDGILE